MCWTDSKYVLCLVYNYTKKSLILSRTLRANLLNLLLPFRSLAILFTQFTLLHINNGGYIGTKSANLYILVYTAHI